MNKTTTVLRDLLATILINECHTHSAHSYSVAVGLRIRITRVVTRQSNTAEKGRHIYIYIYK